MVRRSRGNSDGERGRTREHAGALSRRRLVTATDQKKVFMEERKKPLSLPFRLSAVRDWFLGRPCTDNVRSKLEGVVSGVILVLVSRRGS